MNTGNTGQEYTNTGQAILEFGCEVLCSEVFCIEEIKFIVAFCIVVCTCESEKNGQVLIWLYSFQVVSGIS